MEKREILIIGAGPAGLAASIEAAQTGAQVLLIDENDTPGGQLFKQIHKFFGSSKHKAGTRGINIGKQMLEQTKEVGVELWLNTTAVGTVGDKQVALVRKKEDGTSETVVVEAEEILVACGGAENAVNFEGWTLPGVMGAGAAQTMVNVRRVLPGKKILMVGSGNVGLIVSYQLMQAGANVVGIVEAAPKIGGYCVHAGKIRRAGVPVYLSHTVLHADPDENGEVKDAVIVQLDEHFQPIAGTEKKLDCDTICIATGLRPQIKISTLLGVKNGFIPELGGWMPIHDENMETNVHGIFVAGDTAGVEEASTAMDEGRLAGVSMAHQLGHLTDAEAADRKKEIVERLEALRLGPFGERRQNAKNRIVAEGKKHE